MPRFIHLRARLDHGAEPLDFNLNIDHIESFYVIGDGPLFARTTVVQMHSGAIYYIDGTATRTLIEAAR